VIVLHVLMLSWEFPPKVVGGLGRHVYDLSTALTAHDIDVTVVTMDPGDGNPELEIINGVKVHRVQPYPLAAPSFLTWVMQMNMALMEKSAGLLNEESIDVVHAHDWLAGFCGKALKHAYRIPLISTIHATEYGRNNGLHNDEQRFISDVEWWLTYESWRVICCSDFMSRELQRLFQLPSDKLRVIFNGVHPEIFQVDKPDPGVRRRYAADDEQLIFFIGRLVNEKGVQVLLDAVPSILNQHRRTKFVIAGEGPCKEGLMEQARHLGIEHHVYFAGFVDDYTRNHLYRSAAAAVFPSLYEPFGIVALEAMAANTPLVVADTGGLGEIVTHEVSGLKCYPGSPTSLADQVNRILSQTALADKLKDTGRALVMNSYTWPEIARKTKEVYREVLAEYDSSTWKIPRWQPAVPQYSSPGYVPEPPH
jgi:glycogen synthase